MGPAQLSTQCVDNFLGLEHLAKARHVVQVLGAETAPMIGLQLPRQRSDDLFAVTGLRRRYPMVNRTGATAALGRRDASYFPLPPASHPSLACLIRPKPDPGFAACPLKILRINNTNSAKQQKTCI